MSAKENKAVVLRYFLESHNPPYNLDVMDETCIPEYAEAHKRWQRMERAALPDKVFTLEDVIAEGTRWCCAGPSVARIGGISARQSGRCTRPASRSRSPRR
jgi:hypothetical protein